MALSARRIKFVNEYMVDNNGSRAARAAGYAVSGARVTAHRLLTNANVKAAIASKAHELAQQYTLSKHSVIKEIRSAIDIAKVESDANSIIRGWIEIAKLMRFYDIEITAPLTTADKRALKAKLESMTDEQLMAITSNN